MIEDFADAAAGIGEEVFDLCIVGTGAAGLCLAMQFAGTRRRVVVLEAGGQGHQRGKPGGLRVRTAGQYTRWFNGGSVPRVRRFHDALGRAGAAAQPHRLCRARLGAAQRLADPGGRGCGVLPGGGAVHAGGRRRLRGGCPRGAACRSTGAGPRAVRVPVQQVQPPAGPAAGLRGAVARGGEPPCAARRESALARTHAGPRSRRRSRGEHARSAPRDRPRAGVRPRGRGHRKRAPAAGVERADTRRGR